jgi:D-arginine dehydrogenase
MSTESHSADALVIGGGIAGASAAWSLGAHMRVVVVEREPTLGHHATGRSASVLNQTSGHPVVCALARASRPFFERPPDAFCDHALLGERGLMWVGRAEDRVLLDELHAQALRVAPDVLRLDAGTTGDALRGHFLPDAIAGGAVHEPGAMSIDTAAMLQAYVAGVRRLGGTILTTSEAVTARPSGGGWESTIGSGDDAITITTRYVVDAAGAWGDVVAERCGVRSVGLVALRRTAALVPAPDWVRSLPLVMDVAGRYYLEPESGGLLVSPADETRSDPCDARAEELDVALAIEHVNDATDLAIRSVRSTWAGLRTFAPDRVPVVGEDPDRPGFWWLVGQGGAGIKTAPALGALVAAQITGEPNALPSTVADIEVSPARFR